MNDDDDDSNEITTVIPEAAGLVTPSPLPLSTPIAAPMMAAGSAGFAGRSTVVDSCATLLKPSEGGSK